MYSALLKYSTPLLLKLKCAYKSFWGKSCSNADSDPVSVEQGPSICISNFQVMLMLLMLMLLKRTLNSEVLYTKPKLSR